MMLSEHFSLAELTATTDRSGIDNTPDAAQLERLKYTARGAEHIRLILGVPIIVLSGLRVLELNVIKGGAMTAEALRQVGRETRIDAVRDACIQRLRDGQFGERISQHVDGEAIDWIAPKFGTPLECCRAIEGSDVRFDQLIYEVTWCHTSFIADNVPRHEVLTIKRGQKAVQGLIA